MDEWQPMDDAPRDGRWIILEVETGGHLFEPRVGRFAPKEFGTGVYEWQVVCRMPGGLDEFVPVDEIYNHYSEGVVSGWLPLP